MAGRGVEEGRTHVGDKFEVHGRVRVDEAVPFEGCVGDA